MRLAARMKDVRVEMAFLETSLTNSFLLAMRKDKGAQQEYDDFKIAMKGLHDCAIQCGDAAYAKVRMRKGMKHIFVNRASKSSTTSKKSKVSMKKIMKPQSQRVNRRKEAKTQSRR